ncbi:MAG: D-glucuronyl C5-epimerase family protein [candidate division Zixibacteria bacterium]|nr:D-glucuronyl C5-epimerase family protein [candidate division Zixibacteria bacterium]
MKPLKVQYLLLLLIFVVTSCGNDKQLINPVLNNNFTIETANQDEFELIVHDFVSLPNTSSSVDESILVIPPFDDDYIEMFPYGSTTTYHPVGLSHRCFLFIGTYFHTQDTIHLKRAEKYARKLMEVSNMIGDTALVPYMFDYRVHGLENAKLLAPWYSGMAQGEFLEVLVRLYEFTENQEYLEFAHKIFNSFLRLENNNSDWVVRIDSLGYYWIEEYPHDNPGQTLNGFIAAVIGIYDYYRVTEDEKAKTIYNLCLTTLKHYIPRFRRENLASYYCLGHNHLAQESYHNFHIRLFNNLHQFSNDDFFKEMADLYKADGEAFFTE